MFTYIHTLLFKYLHVYIIVFIYTSCYMYIMFICTCTNSGSYFIEDLLWFRSTLKSLKLYEYVCGFVHVGAIPEESRRW